MGHLEEGHSLTKDLPHDQDIVVPLPIYQGMIGLDLEK